MHTAPHGGTIPPNVLVTAFKPDIVVVSQMSQEVVVLELTCPWDSNIARSHHFKSDKYAPLIADLSRTRVVSFFAIEVSARGQIFKDNRSRLSSFLFKCCSGPRSLTKSMLNIASKSALLSSYSIFCARMEPTWENPAPLVLQ